MVINHGAALRKDYFISYLRLIMNVKSCNIETASKIAFQRIFKDDRETYGSESYHQFLVALNDIKKENEIHN